MDSKDLPTQADVINWIRRRRNTRLNDTEQFGYGVSDRPWPDGWVEYRQELRDLLNKIESGEITVDVDFNDFPEMPQSFIDLQ